jgi:hypothetical protein
VSTARVDFTRAAAERIANVVRTVEIGDRDGAPLNFGRVPDAGGKVFRICTFTGTWAKNAPKVVTYKYQSATPNTVSARNVFVGMTATTGGNCAIAKDGTAWFLIQAECGP